MKFTNLDLISININNVREKENYSQNLYHWRLRSWKDLHHNAIHKTII